LIPIFLGLQESDSYIESDQTFQSPLNFELIRHQFYFQKLSVDVEKPQAVINDGFYELVQAQRLSAGENPLARKMEKPVWGDDHTNWSEIAKIIPKVMPRTLFNLLFLLIVVYVQAFSLKVGCSTLTGMRDHSRPDFCAVLQSFQVKSSFSTVPFGRNNLILMNLKM